MLLAGLFEMSSELNGALDRRGVMSKPRQIRHSIPLGAAIAIVVVSSSDRAEAQVAPDPASKASVLVHVDAPCSVELQRESRSDSDDGDEFHKECTSPCDAAVPAEGRYRIAGSGVRDSPTFALPKGTAGDTIVVNPASTLAFAGGIVLISVGGAAASFGAMAVLGASLSGSDDHALTIGYGLLGGGLAGVAAGLVITLVNRHSTIAFVKTPAAPPPAPPASYEVLRDRHRLDAVQTPTWSAPLVTGSF